MDWIDYYDSDHTIYVSKLHRDLHFQIIARDIIGYIPSPEAVVLDYSSGEALSAGAVAEACGKLILAEPAPGVRSRLIARFASNTKISIYSLEDVRNMAEQSIDLVVMNSVTQYIAKDKLDSTLAVIRRLLKPSGKLVLGDILRPDTGTFKDALALLRFSARHGFLKDALRGLIKTALSNYRQLHAAIGLQRYSEAEIMAKLRAAGLMAERATTNIGHNPWRMTFIAHPTCGCD